ncbi:chemosensory receptor B [Elysia marginata]|uniref:Chemosensory receptor B n=1 Tax=Elysia marginata TaxID=1093978 RepID=A0AAV4IIF1_9GAST|nr:chemosensory receptor B [Elysia marginata]
MEKPTTSRFDNDKTPQVSQLLSSADLITMMLYTFSTTIPICIFGILSNIVNIVVFYKMGFSSPSNINLFCLAIADLLILCYILLVSAGNHPLFLNARLSISMVDVARTGALVYYSFSALASWITAVINVERSCCIAFPMKVKESSYFPFISK